MLEKNSHEVELNFYYLHYNDCKYFVQLTANENSKLKSFYARHAILAAVFASEALINRVFKNFYLFNGSLESIEKLSITDKWYFAPLLCGKLKPFEKTFDCSRQPFQDFQELIKIRNSLVHPKLAYIEALRKDDNSSIRSRKTGQEVPWVEVLKSKTWGITRIPLNPFEYNNTHAEKALKILDAMTNKLKHLMQGCVTDDWLTEINLRDKNAKCIEKISMDSLWGGYSPNKKI